jgi:outer membrane protein OmpA-like peptidoglycan-associated protein
LILEDGRLGVLNSIYFEPETAVLIELYRSVLNAVGRRLAADPSLNLLIRAYTADFGTTESQYAVSSDRAVFSRDFLATEYSISASRFSSELYGSYRSPKYATEDWQTHRCVELILVRD